MARIDYLIFGYRKMKIPPENISTVSSILLRAGISSQIAADGIVLIRERDVHKIKEILSGRTKSSLSEPMGLYGIWKNLKYKALVIISLIITLAFTISLSGFVWDIRVEGNEQIPDGEIVVGLKECGFEIGSIWGLTNLSKIENDFLINNSSIGWININRRGTVAYIKVLENQDDDFGKGDDEDKYYNIVASEDCVIEDITVIQGVAMVKPGDTVRRGEVLVAGILPPELGGGLCAAEATVVGRVSDRVKVFVPRIEQIKGYKNRQLNEITIKFFKFSLNIFKFYGNLTNDCDIIDDEITYSFFGRCKLPISLVLSYVINYDIESVTHSDTELCEISRMRLNSLCASLLCNADLLHIKTQGRFTDDGYEIYSDITFLADVGEREELKTK